MPRYPDAPMPRSGSGCSASTAFVGGNRVELDSFAHAIPESAIAFFGVTLAEVGKQGTRLFRRQRSGIGKQILTGVSARLIVNGAFLVVLSQQEALELASALDRRLSEINIEYAGKRSSLRLGGVRLELLAEGKSAEETMKILHDGDEKIETRQVGIVDAKGNVVTFTGKKCQA